MDTNKKITLPHPNNPTLIFEKKKSPPLYAPQKSQFSEKSTPPPPPPPRKKINLPNLHDLERFHKNCALSTL